MAEEQIEAESIDQLIGSLSKKGMPAMANSITQMGQLTSSDDARVSQLTEQVLKDPTLTTRVLQVANSVIYRGSGQVNTITRAIVLMGFTSIRDISLSMKVLDEMLKKSPTQHLKNVMAKSFHAAMQAKGLVSKARYGVKEEIFISSLLHHLGEMSVLSRDDDLSKNLNDLISKQGVSPDMAAQQVLGFSFQDLTLGLANSWGLGDMMKEAVSPPVKLSRPVEAVLLGEELSQVAGLGWDSEPVNSVVKRIADFGGIDTTTALEQAKQVADYAREVASHYGAEAVKHLIPPSNYTTDTARRLNVITFTEDIDVVIPVETTESEAETVDNNSSYAVAKNDASEEVESLRKTQKIMVELDITPDMIDAALRKVPLPPMKTLLEQAETKSGPSQGSLSNNVEKVMGESVGCDEGVAASVTQSTQSHMVTGRLAEKVNPDLHMEYMKKIGDLLAGKKLNVNEMFSLIIKAMNDALGMERVALALLSKDRGVLKAKLFGGDVSEAFESSFEFKVDIDNAFSYAIGQAQPFWAGRDKTGGKDYLITKPIVNVLGQGGFFVAPIVVSRKPIGVFYADQRASGVELTGQQFMNFSMLAQQASIALSMLK
ncbi:MAG: HDOD domain-containing protein [Pseudomonadales bacterium]|nr:HDOD domain-containing protein [Pseudomonadales bacterium]